MLPVAPVSAAAPVSAVGPVRAAAPVIAPVPIRVLDEQECWTRLADHDLGRLAVRAGAGVDVFPVNYLVHDRAIYFRSAPGSKLVDLTRQPEVAFEIDGEFAHYVWSVVVRGTAVRVGSDDEIHASGVAQLAAWHPGDKFNYVRVSPATVSGRSFAASR